MIRNSHDTSGILSENIKIPVHWTDKGSKYKTRVELKEAQKADVIPNNSYDIDGDGNVGIRDYFLSRLYDKDKKGFLTDEERKELYDAIKNGIEHKYIWNVEQAGKDRPYRLIQKRGKIIDAEDFQSVRDTKTLKPLI